MILRKLPFLIFLIACFLSIVACSNSDEASLETHKSISQNQIESDDEKVTSLSSSVKSILNERIPGNIDIEDLKLHTISDAVSTKRGFFIANVTTNGSFYEKNLDRVIDTAIIEKVPYEKVVVSGKFDFSPEVQKKFESIDIETTIPRIYIRHPRKIWVVDRWEPGFEKWVVKNSEEYYQFLLNYDSLPACTCPRNRTCRDHPPCRKTAKVAESKSQKQETKVKPTVQKKACQPKRHNSTGANTVLGVAQCQAVSSSGQRWILSTPTYNAQQCFDYMKACLCDPGANVTHNSVAMGAVFPYGVCSISLSEMKRLSQK